MEAKQNPFDMIFDIVYNWVEWWNEIYIPNLYLGLGEENDDNVATVTVRYARVGWWFMNDLVQNVFIVKYILI